MQKNQDQITVYSLSLEELALSIGMINQRELSHVLLRTTYPDLTDLQMRSRLISATSSLLAAELATLTKDRTAQLSEALQLAVFPFAVYDRMLRIGILRKGSADNITIYLQKGKRFTSHRVETGVVHKLSTGGMPALPEHILSFFTSHRFGSKTELEARFPASLLDTAEKLPPSQSQVETQLSSAGWPAAAASALAQDLNAPAMRARIVLQEINNRMTPPETYEARQHVLALVQGNKRTWLIDFPPESPEVGKARQVSLQDFKEAVNSLLA